MFKMSSKEGKSCTDSIILFLKNLLLCKTCCKENLSEVNSDIDTSKWVLQKAIDVVILAVEADKKMHYEEALRLYNDAIEYFNYSSENEVVSDRVKEAIKRKNNLYIERAEKIKCYLRNKQECEKSSYSDTTSLI